ncbi:hypothetical protein ACTZGI_02225 [Rahnella aceris]|uniref:hypothetical protein n=1 Tax=Rahnella sp. (strain Y9602) TaxID=2703885 RepID=UPI003FD3388B
MEDFIEKYLVGYKLILFIGAFCLAWIRVRDLSFFMGVVLRALRINYSDHRFDEYDNKQYNLHLFKLKNGVNVQNLDDAVIVNIALEDGVIESKLLRFSGFFGPVGIKRTMKAEAIIVPIYALFIIFGGLSILFAMPPSKAGFATYNTSPPLFVSLYGVYDKENDKYFNKTDCLNLNENVGSAIKRACGYITTNDNLIRDELKEGIKSDKMAKQIIGGIVAFAILLGYVLLVGFTRFKLLNKIVCDIKKIDRI